MEVFINNLSEDNITKWNGFLEQHPERTVFQSHDMYSFYEKVHHYEPFLFNTTDNNNEINGVLLAVLIKEGNGLKGYFSSRVVIYGGPLITNTPEKLKVLDLLLNQLVQTLKKKSIFIQFRNFFGWGKKEKAIFGKYGFQYKDRLNIVIKTENREKVWKNISQSRKRQIKKALRSGVQITPAQNIDEVRVFYSLLKKLYHDKVKKPLPDISFFETFYTFSSQSRLGIFLLIKKETEIIGGILAPVTPGKNVYEWYVVGEDRKHRKHYPSVLATWMPIDFALRNRLEYFDFMGLGLPGKPYGVRDFKMKFGGDLVNYGRFGKRNNKWLYQFAELGYNVLRLFHRIR